MLNWGLAMTALPKPCLFTKRFRSEPVDSPLPCFPKLSKRDVLGGLFTKRLHDDADSVAPLQPLPLTLSVHG